MNRILNIITISFLLVVFSSCRKYEFISREGSKVIVDKGYVLPSRTTTKTRVGKIIETDTITGYVVSITKYRQTLGCFGPFKLKERKQTFENGKKTGKWYKKKQKSKRPKHSCGE